MLGVFKRSKKAGKKSKGNFKTAEGTLKDLIILQPFSYNNFNQLLKLEV